MLDVGSRKTVNLGTGLCSVKLRRLKEFSGHISGLLSEDLSFNNDIFFGFRLPGITRLFSWSLTIC